MNDSKWTLYLIKFLISVIAVYHKHVQMFLNLLLDKYTAYFSHRIDHNVETFIWNIGGLFQTV